MYMSLAQAKIREDSLRDVADSFQKIIARRLTDTPGCKNAWLLKNEGVRDEFITLSLWSSRSDIEKFIQTTDYTHMMKELNQIMAEPSDWTMQLSEDLTLEYVPVSETPTIDTYNVRISTDEMSEEQNAAFYVRVFSFNIKSGKQNDFVSLYENVIVETLKRFEGCRGAYLCENRIAENSYISVTLWTSKLYSDRYEQSGTFSDLVKKVEHTFSDISRAVTEKRSAAVASDEQRLQRFAVIARMKT